MHLQGRGEACVESMPDGQEHDLIRAHRLIFVLQGVLEMMISLPVFAANGKHGGLFEVKTFTLDAKGDTNVSK
jgi:steroid 5-alpha reductase family enzyme